MLQARQLLVDGKASEARSVLIPLAYDPHNYAGSNRALALIELIDSGKIKDAVDGTPADTDGPDDDPSG